MCSFALMGVCYKDFRFQEVPTPSPSRPHGPDEVHFEKVQVNKGPLLCFGFQFRFFADDSCVFLFLDCLFGVCSHVFFLL